MFRYFLFAISVLIPINSHAFPLTSARNWALANSIEIQSDGFNFNGIVAMSNCSASFVRLKGASDDSRGMVLTNGHCVGGSPFFGGMIQPGEVYYNKPKSFSVNLLDRNANRIATLRSEKIIYATMTDTDMALLELTQTYRQIRQATGVEALEIVDQMPAIGTQIEIPSGYWKKTYACAIEAIIPTLREANWTMKQSIRYSPVGCEVIGGTSGSPIMSVATGEVIGINNTGNESGERCTMNNPCEVDERGNVSVIRGRGYGQQIFKVYTCLNSNRAIDLTEPGCELPLGRAI